MCHGTTCICRTCGRSDTRYTERCPQDIVDQDEARGIQHRIFGRILLTRQCRQCREAERRRATIEANEIGRQIPRAKHLLEFLRGEQLHPVREAELELAYQAAYLERERLHPYVDGSSRVTEIREGLTGYPEGLQHFNDAIARQAEIDRERRQIAIADLPLRLDPRRLRPPTPIELARRLADGQEEDLAERGSPDEHQENGEPEQAYRDHLEGLSFIDAIREAFDLDSPLPVLEQRDSVTAQNEGPLVAGPNLPEQNQPPARPNTPELKHTPYDPVEERRREENYMLCDAAAFANSLEELYQGIPASEARNTGLRVICQVQDFLDEFFLPGARLPSAEQWWWILSTNQRIEAVLHGELSADDLDNGAPPANEDDIVGQFERERNRIQRRAAERTERLRSNLRPRTPDPDSQASDEEDMNE